MRRAQVEVMGFALIIVLLIIGLLLFLGWKTFLPAGPPPVTEKEFALAFVSALPKVTTACGSMTDLIQNCAWGTNNLGCDPPPCRFLKEELDFILTDLLEERSNQPYRFAIRRGTGLLNPQAAPEDQVYAKEFQCGRTVRAEAPAQGSIPLYPRLREDAAISLVLCQP